MKNTVTEKIKLWGIVQGVGFRPFAAKIAECLNMKGEIRNLGGLVEILITDSKERINAFVNALETEKPEPAEIVHLKREEVTYKQFSSFTIRKSGFGDEEAAMIPADLAVCPECLKEMKEPMDPRFNHPMISCMVCGPRYTIIDRFPYDRENTSMTDFRMCDFCESEYESVKDRRYHAQTISCHSCGPYLKFKSNYVATGDIDTMTACNGTDDDNASFFELDRTDGQDVLDKATKLLKEGNVIAYKSIGGYNLMADPLNNDAVIKLREIKKRESKPFAVMFVSVEQICKYCRANNIEKRLLTSSSRPILLLERKARTSEFNHSRFIGSFLPSMGAQYMLLEKFGGPLIATSANLSSMPIIKEDEEMFAMMKREPLIAGVVYNDRKIRVSVDDSVARVIDGQPQIIRRSKGYAPVPLYVDEGLKSGQILASGGQLKNSFALTKGPFVYMSKYFGDLDCVESRKIYEENLKKMKRLFRIKPDKVVCDLHPLYYTTVFAEKYAEKYGLPLLKVQHHHAHVASVMAEHNIKGPVIGVSFDGTGYGVDGNIWGGEFLLCEKASFKRIAHLKYIEMPGGDVSMKDAWKPAISYLAAEDIKDRCHADEISFDLSYIIDYYERSGIQLTDEQTEKLVRSAITHGINTIKSSSAGRLFDAVAALLGICSRNSYEGECAIKLEDAAARAMRSQSGTEVEKLSLLFHEKAAYMILENCRKIREKTGVKKVALTGGVFQNKVLTELVLEYLRKAQFSVYYNISVSPNDGGIALGQSFIAMQED